MVYSNGSWVSLIYDHHFQDFYPVYGPKLKGIVLSTCFGNYTNYANHNGTCNDWQDYGWTIGPADCAGYNLLNCVLDQLPDTVKADMAASGILLGLLPVLLSLVGSTTAEVGLLALRRPLLASMLALASPGISTMKFHDYRDAFAPLRKHHQPIDPTGFAKKAPWLQSVFEYGLAATALANMIMVASDLTRKAIAGNDPNRDYQVLVWTLWAFAIHLSGALVFKWLVQLRKIEQSATPSHAKKISWARLVVSKVKGAATPCGSQPPATIRFKQETYKFVILAWATSVGTAVHIAYGTYIFATLMFLSGGEGLQVLCRCMASVVLCRMILVYELHGMSQTVRIEEEEAGGPGAIVQLGGTDESYGKDGTGVEVIETAYRRVGGQGEC